MNNTDKICEAIRDMQKMHEIIGVGLVGAVEEVGKQLVKILGEIDQNKEMVSDLRSIYHVVRALEFEPRNKEDRKLQKELQQQVIGLVRALMISDKNEPY